MIQAIVLKSYSLQHFFLLGAILFITMSGYGQDIPLETITFEESDEIFPNPERGFYHHRVLNRLRDISELYDNGITLIYGKIAANAFREQDFSEEFLTLIQDAFNAVRKVGVKVIPAVAYNDRIGDEDASKEQIFRHIDQLQPLWERNADVIYLLKAGFIGSWGEWHSSTHGLDTPENRSDILFKILTALPKDRMVVLRSPLYKRQIFKEEVLSLDRAFDGSNLARTGFHNDCFLSSDDDVGTYQFEPSRAAGITYIGGETRFTPFGGETCGLHEYGECKNAITEMELLHCSWLNRDYHRRVLSRWIDQGCMDEIKRRMGYRFVLRNARLTKKVRAGGRLRLSLTLDNVGFSSPFNPRIVELILCNNKNGKKRITPVSVDPRFWFPGNPIQFSLEFQIPSSLSEGKYTIFLRLPDPYETLYPDPRYSIRFANHNVWDKETWSESNHR